MSERRSTVSATRVTALLVLSALPLLGCLGRSPDVEHFMLGTTTLAVTGSGTESDLSVLVGPVILPAYLERPQIASFEEGGEVELAEFERWLGGFEANFLRAVSLGLARRLQSIQVVAHPSSPPFPLDYRVRLHVDDLVFVSDQNVLRTRIRWALAAVESKSRPELFLLENLLAVEDDSVEGLVEAHERAIADLVSRIADAIERLEASPEDPVR